MNTSRRIDLSGLNRRAKLVILVLGVLLIMLLAEVAILVGMGIKAGNAASTGRTHVQDAIKPDTSEVPVAAWRASDVLRSLQATGLDVEAIPGGKKNDELGMSVHADEIRFRTHAGTILVGGIILAFDSQDELIQMMNYYRTLGQALPAAKSWVFSRDNVLIQINGDLPAEQAKRFEEALGSIGE